MTRDFNKPPRENRRGYSRNPSPGRRGEERTPRPARPRPRLNRETVDRAWENGARPNHADYRTRTGNNGQPARENRRRDGQSNQPSAQNRRKNRRPSEGDRYDSRDNQRTRSRSQHPRARTRDAGTRDGDAYQYNERRQGGRDYQRYEAQISPRRTRPERQPGKQARKAQGPPRPRTGGELFEGDYEQFDQDAPQNPGSRSKNQQGQGPQSQERHATRLPDGRVLKGPRPAQHRNAQFWTEVDQEAEGLLEHVKSPAKPRSARKTPAPKKQAKTRTRAASSTVGDKQARARKSTSKPSPSAAKPPRRRPR